MRQWWGEINERDADDGDTAKRSGAQPVHRSCSTEKHIPWRLRVAFCTPRSTHTRRSSHRSKQGRCPHTSRPHAKTVIVAVSVSKARVAPLGVPGPASFLRPAHTHALSAAMLTKIARKSPTAALTQAIKDAEHAKGLAHSYSHAFSHIPLPPWPFVRRRSAPRRPAHDTNSQDHTRTGMEAQGRCMPRKNDGGFYERAWRKKRGNQRECGYEGY